MAPAEPPGIELSPNAAAAAAVIDHSSEAGDFNVAPEAEEQTCLLEDGGTQKEVFSEEGADLDTVTWKEILSVGYLHQQMQVYILFKPKFERSVHLWVVYIKVFEQSYSWSDWRALAAF